MISKKIHYCWFGQSEMPKDVLKMLETWQLQMPDYEMILWHEQTFDIESVAYVFEAYQAKKYAYVSDYVRLHALYHHGGLYFDTDVEVLKSFDDLLNNQAFIGYEGNKLLGTGVLGAESTHPWIGRLLGAYEHKSFVQSDGTHDLTLNSVLISKIMVDEYGWNPKEGHQMLKAGVHVYPANYLSAKDCVTGEIFADEQTYSIHHFG